MCRVRIRPSCGFRAGNLGRLRISTLFTPSTRDMKSPLYVRGLSQADLAFPQRHVWACLLNKIFAYIYKAFHSRVASTCLDPVVARTRNEENLTMSSEMYNYVDACAGNACAHCIRIHFVARVRRPTR